MTVAISFGVAGLQRTCDSAYYLYSCVPLEYTWYGLPHKSFGSHYHMHVICVARTSDKTR